MLHKPEQTVPLMPSSFPCWCVDNILWAGTLPLTLPPSHRQWRISHPFFSFLPFFFFYSVSPDLLISSEVVVGRAMECHILKALKAFCKANMERFLHLVVCDEWWCPCLELWLAFPRSVNRRRSWRICGQTSLCISTSCSQTPMWRSSLGNKRVRCSLEQINFLISHHFMSDIIQTMCNQMWKDTFVLFSAGVYAWIGINFVLGKFNHGDHGECLVSLGCDSLLL